MFHEKRILVTGGSRGIGWATAKAFLDAGARVAVNGRTGDSTSAGIERLGGGERLIAAPGDVGTVAGCEAAVGIAVDALGGLDVLVNNAGVGTSCPIDEADEAFWDAMIDVNLKGTYFCCRAAMPALRESRGNIVNVASMAGLMGHAGLSVYCASKGGVVLLTRSLSAELAPDMRINCVCPGYVDTDMVHYASSSARMAELDAYAPMNRIGKPEEIAAAILYLASNRAGFVTGAALSIDGGTTASY